MLGAIVGDVVGSVYEHHRTADMTFPLFTDFSRFTDDTVLTVATAHALLNEGSFAEAYWTFGNEYPNAGYGGTFRHWLRTTDKLPYNSFGNGSAMRVSPVGWWYKTEADVLEGAERSAAPTHNNPEGIKGAQAVALAVFLARTKRSRDDIRAAVSALGYDMTRSLADIRPTYSFDVTCQGSVPEAITAFLESTDVENAIRLAITLGGDADTQAAIAGAIAEAFYGGVPEPLVMPALKLLPQHLLQTVREFRRTVKP